MRVLITGINGFVGGYLVEELIASTAWHIWGATREPALTLPQPAERVRAIVTNLLDRTDVDRCIAEARPELVFHLAAQAHAPTSFRDPAATLTTNILMQLNLFEAVRAARLDPQFVVVGTGEVYGAVQPEHLPLTEDAPMRPTSPYAVSKVAQDALAFQYWAAHGLRTVRARPFNHTGPRQEPRYVVTEFAQQIARIEAGQQEPVLRVGNLLAERDFSDVRDVVRAYRLLAEHGQPGEAYNIGSGQPVAIRTILDTLLSFSSTPIAIETDPARMRPADVPRVVCDSRKLRERTHWTPHFSLEDTLRDVLNAWRDRVRHTTH